MIAESSIVAVRIVRDDEARVQFSALRRAHSTTVVRRTRIAETRVRFSLGPQA